MSTGFGRFRSGNISFAIVATPIGAREIRGRAQTVDAEL